MNMKDNRSKLLKTKFPEINPSNKLIESHTFTQVEQVEVENEEKKIIDKAIKDDSFMNKSISSDYKKNVCNPNVSSIKKNKETLTQDQIQFKLKKVFEYYCQFGERMNILNMKSQKYYKLLTDCKLIDDNLNKTRIELIFSSENKHKPQMNFETFLNSLIRVAEIKYDKIPSNQAVQKLIKENLIQRYDTIFDNTTNKESQIVVNNNFDASTLIDARNSMIICNNDFTFETDTEILLAEIAPVMFDIYRVYFPFELSLAENSNFVIENSQKYYFLLLKDFDLCPTIVSKSTSFQIFQTEMNSLLEITENYMNIIQNLDFNSIKKFSTKNVLGQYFNFFKFLRCIMRIADLSFDKLETNVSRKLTLFEKLVLCLERMELSDGFLTIQQKTSKTHNRRTTSIIPKEISDNVKFNIFEINPNDDVTSNENNIDIKNTNSINNKSINKLRKSITGIQEKPQYEHSAYIMEKYGNDLLNLFKFYCSFGDPLNTKYITNTKWTKFLREAGLIKGSKQDTKQFNYVIESSNEYGIPYYDIDRHFFKVTNTVEKPRESVPINSSTISLKGNDPKSKIVNSNSKIDFNTFINLLEYSCAIIFPHKDFKDAIDYIIVNHILPLTKNISNRNPSLPINFLMEKETKPELVEILVYLHKAFHTIFKYYSNRYTFLMNFENFLQFCRDFSIFPEIVPKSKLNLFFKSISSCMSLSENSDDKYFVDLLALCAFEVPYRDPQPSPIEKILFFVEKLSQSEGTNKILLKSGSTRLVAGENLDIISLFKTHYPDYFNVKTVIKPNFFDLLSDDS